MPTTSTATNVAQTLDEACARNAPVELHFRSRRGELTVAQSRIIKLDDGNIYLDKPQSVNTEIEFKDNTSVEAHFAIRKGRYFFKSTITDARAKIEIDNRNKTIGLAVAIPIQLKSGQRRNDFRVEISGFYSIDVRLHDAEPVKPDICPIDAKRFTGQVFDVSAGGLCLMIQTSDRDEFHTSDRYFAIFHIPDESDEHAVFLAKPVHWTKSSNKNHTSVGLQFIPWPEVEFPRNQRRIAQFVAKIERQLVKNRAAASR